MMHAPIVVTAVGRPALSALRDGCDGCRSGAKLPIGITMAFQPIVDIRTGAVFAYEALVRGVDGRSAAAVLAAISPDLVYRFDQACRVKAIELAGGLFAPDDGARLSINFMPNAVYEPDACIRASLAAARRIGFDTGRLMFEFTEHEPVRDVAHVRRIVDAYRRHGFTTAIDDFGAGYAGLSLLADLHPDVLKLDMALIRGIDGSATRRAIVAGVVHMADALGVRCIAEGIETVAELRTLRDLGITLCQGYLFARPATEALPPPILP